MHSKGKVWLVVLMLFSFGVGLFFGTTFDVVDGLLSGGEVEINKVVDVYSRSRSPEVAFDQYWAVWDKVKQKFVDQPVKDVDLFYGSIQGMVEALGDPHSNYLPPQPAKEFAEGLSGAFEGIGAEIGIRNEQLIIIAPLPGSPAEKAQLKPGDKILAIDDMDTAGISLDKAVSKIRGPKGTQVMLTITRDGLKDSKEITVTRDTIKVPTVIWEMKEGRIAYMRIGYFNEQTWTQFDKAVKEMLVEAPEGIVLDMRSNPGGFLDTAVRVASEWVENGVIVKEKFVGDKSNEYITQGEHRLKGIPTIILVDEGAASGSEIVAGALQDYGIAKLVGKKTFGKGSVQDFEVLPDGSALKLTIARWYTPNDRQIDQKGIDPDVVIEGEMFEKKEGTEGATKEDFIDRGLEKAIELLK